MEKVPPLRVLIVDDESLMRWSLGETLAAQGHTVVEAADGRGALRALDPAHVAFDLALVDYRLPDISGLDLLMAIRRACPHCKFVLMTAYGTPDLTREAFERGAASVVHKPIEMGAVADVVARALAPSS